MTWAAGPTPRPLDRWLGELRRAVAWRRRLLAAGLAAGAMACALQVLAPPPPAGVEVIVAARDVAAGAVLGRDDVRLRRRPVTAVPAGALTALGAALGVPVASGVRRGEVLTDVRLVGPSALRGLGSGLVATPVRVADVQAAAVLRPGDVVDVLAAGTSPAAGGPARLVASAVRVLAVPHDPASGLSGASGAAGDALLLLATTSTTAARLAGAAVTDRLSVVVRGP